MTAKNGMEDLSPVNRPVTIGEIAVAFRVPPDRLRRLAERHRIKPACRIGRTRLYGPVQIRRIFAVLESATAAEESRG